ncbi:hypothetical protein LTR53_004391 [Teratosphaeriaceae sp. CCFEE 6253]|nr:hypothetical protein LTR53_004391 [Teratosphaeriaceae sp. CCFEE 6253]
MASAGDQADVHAEPDDLPDYQTDSEKDLPQASALKDSDADANAHGGHDANNPTPSSSWFGRFRLGLTASLDSLRGVPRVEGPRTPQGASPVHRHNSWQSIRRARGRLNLTNAVRGLLRRRGRKAVNDVLQRIAMANSELPHATRARFELRYLNGATVPGLVRESEDELYENLSDRGDYREWEVGDLAEAVTLMLFDEVDLPGQRRSTISRRWDRIVEEAQRTGNYDDLHPLLSDAEGFDPNDETREAFLGGHVLAFIKDYGLRVLFEVFMRTHVALALTIIEPLALASPRPGLPGMKEPRETDRRVAARVVAALFGREPVALKPGTMPLGFQWPQWRGQEHKEASTIEHQDGAQQRRSVEESIRAIELSQLLGPATWRRDFHLVQRHIFLYGETFDLLWHFRRILPLRLVQRIIDDPQGAATEICRLGYRYTIDDNVAAMLADGLTTQRLETARGAPRSASSDGSGSAPGDGRPTSNPEDQQSDNSDQDSSSSSHSDDDPFAPRRRRNGRYSSQKWPPKQIRESVELVGRDGRRRESISPSQRAVERQSNRVAAPPGRRAQQYPHGLNLRQSDGRSGEASPPSSARSQKSVRFAGAPSSGYAGGSEDGGGHVRARRAASSPPDSVSGPSRPPTIITTSSGGTSSRRRSTPPTIVEVSSASSFSGSSTSGEDLLDTLEGLLDANTPPGAQSPGGRNTSRSPPSSYRSRHGPTTSPSSKGLRARSPAGDTSSQPRSPPYRPRYGPTTTPSSQGTTSGGTASSLTTPLGHWTPPAGSTLRSAATTPGDWDLGGVRESPLAQGDSSSPPYRGLSRRSSTSPSGSPGTWDLGNVRASPPLRANSGSPPYRGLGRRPSTPSSRSLASTPGQWDLGGTRVSPPAQGASGSPPYRGLRRRPSTPPSGSSSSSRLSSRRSEHLRDLRSGPDDTASPDTLIHTTRAGARRRALVAVVLPASAPPPPPPRRSARLAGISPPVATAGGVGMGRSRGVAGAGGRGGGAQGAGGAPRGSGGKRKRGPGGRGGGGNKRARGGTVNALKSLILRLLFTDDSWINGFRKPWTACKCVEIGEGKAIRVVRGHGWSSSRQRDGVKSGVGAPHGELKGASGGLDVRQKSRKACVSLATVVASTAASEVAAKDEDQASRSTSWAGEEARGETSLWISRLHAGVSQIRARSAPYAGAYVPWGSLAALPIRRAVGREKNAGLAVEHANGRTDLPRWHRWDISYRGRRGGGQRGSTRLRLHPPAVSRRGSSAASMNSHLMDSEC